MKNLKRMLRARQLCVDKRHCGERRKFSNKAPHLFNPHQSNVGPLNDKKRGG